MGRSEKSWSERRKKTSGAGNGGAGTGEREKEGEGEGALTFESVDEILNCNHNVKLLSKTSFVAVYNAV